MQLNIFCHNLIEESKSAYIYNSFFPCILLSILQYFNYGLTINTVKLVNFVALYCSSYNISWNQDLKNYVVLFSYCGGH